jgi:murein DD-endopeptidase MepM/ murein hydrolase activator NlpD
LTQPFRAVGSQEKVPCGLTVARGVTPRITGGYAGGAFTHTDDFFNEFYAVDWGTGGKSFPVLAAAGGTLVRHDEPTNLGTAHTLFIKHNDYWQTKYMHLSDCGLVESIGNGQTLSRRVQQGAVIGWAGKSGADAIHLHFELRGGSDSNFTSFASPRCCGNGNCNWSYPVDELGVPAPPDLLAAPCPSSARCPAGSREFTQTDAVRCCSSPMVPGGMWITPENGASISNTSLHLEAHAYPGPGAPAIDYVNFTLWWPGYGPRDKPWKLGCKVTRHTGDVYSCDVNLERVPAGEVTVSFDVYDVAGHHNLAPHGTRTVSWRPANGCRSGETLCRGQCVDLRTHHENCGTCGNPCGIFQKCCQGTCGCDKGMMLVPGYCMEGGVAC